MKIDIKNKNMKKQLEELVRYSVKKYGKVYKMLAKRDSESEKKDYIVSFTYDKKYGGYVSKIASVPGCMTQGKTLKLAKGATLDLLEDLLELSNEKYIESIKQARRDIKDGNYVTFEEVFGDEKETKNTQV